MHSSYCTEGKETSVFTSSPIINQRYETNFDSAAQEEMVQFMDKWEANLQLYLQTSDDIKTSPQLCLTPK